VARVFLDTNVFLYAIGADSPHRAPCRALLSLVGDGAVRAVTSSEVLQEILHVRARRLGLEDAASAVRDASGIVEEVLPVTCADVLCACDLVEARPGLSARDALHVAVMRGARIRSLVSIDRDFDSIEGIERIGPKEALRLRR
jgi:predicted nucleic acid-binding protein